MIKAVIFDLDGTLADTICDLRNAMNEMLEHFGFEKRSYDEIRNAICYGQREFVARSVPHDKRGDEELITRCQKYYSECYNKCYNDNTLPYPGLREMLRDLSEKGIRTAVVTNKSHGHALEVCSKCFPDAVFSLVLGYTGEFPTKPDPASALYAARVMDADVCECVFVGDSDVDIKTGINAGMHTVGVSWGYRDEALLRESGAEAVAHSADELYDILTSQVFPAPV